LEYCLQSSEAKQADIQNKLNSIEISNFKLSGLPTIRFSLNPISFSRSIVSLQDFNTGNYNYTNNNVNNSSAGITISQPINLTGGYLDISTGLNMQYQFSSNLYSYSSTPLNISYSQSLIGGRKTYKFSKQIIDLKKQKLGKSIKKLFMGYKEGV
jgi:hypothetical protein